MPSPAFDSTANQQPFSEADFDALGALLAADWAPETTMNLEQLDGFLAGVICAPRVVMPSTYVPAIFGDEQPEFPDMETARRFYELLMRRHNEIARALNAPVERLDDPRAYDPLLIDWDQNADAVRELAESGEIPRLPLYGELWARGFMDAVHLSREDWAAVPADDEQGAQLVEESLTAILALVPDEEAEDVDEAESIDERDQLVADALIAAYDLRDYWRELQFEQIRVKEPIRRDAKIGRNDPCPCGSGRKFKQCHGREQ